MTNGNRDSGGGIRSRQTDQRGSALVAVLLVLVFLELAILAASIQVVRVAWSFQVVAGRDAADRLAAAGLAEAEALLQVAPTWRGARSGQLAEGEYLIVVEHEAESADGLRVIITGRAWNRRAVELDAHYAWFGSHLAQLGLERRFRYLRGPLPKPS